MSILQPLLHLAAIEAGVILPQALQAEGEVCGGVGVVEERGSVFVGLADSHPVATGHQDLSVLTLSQEAPFDAGHREHGMATVKGGGWWWVGQRHQAGQRQVTTQHCNHRRVNGDGHLEEL